MDGRTRSGVSVRRPLTAAGLDHFLFARVENT
jgi:hypothetical protein